jgi:hypothetical protein
MAVFARSAFLGLAVVLSVLAGAGAASEQLSPSFYSKACPKLAGIVRAGMASAVQTEKRMGASILRLFFHDCFVNVSKTPKCRFSFADDLRLVNGLMLTTRVFYIGRGVTDPSCSTTRRASPARRAPDRKPTPPVGSR